MKYLILTLGTALIVGSPVHSEDPKPNKPASEKEWKEFVEKMNPFGLIQRLREAEARAKVSNNLRQLQLAIQAYQNQPLPKADGQPWQSPNWLLPYIEQSNVYPLFGSNRLGVRLESVGDAMQAQLGLAKGKGLLITDVETNSAAAKAGMKKFDILLQWDGKDLSSKPDAFEEMLRKFTEKNPVTARILRAGKEQEVKGIELQPGMSERIKTYICPSDIRDGTSNTILIPYADGTVRNYLPSQWTWPGISTVDQAPSRIFTTTFRQEDRFTTRYQEGSLVITVTGQIKKDGTTVNAVKVIDGAIEHRYDSIDKTPEEYRDKARDLVKAAEKNQDRIEIQK